MDPYKVLGVSPNDDEETIKKAYRNLVKKYHPDRYANSPLAEEASEKLKEINLAYDIITGKATQSNTTGSGYSGYGNYSGGYSQQTPPSFQAVRMLISMHMLNAAVQMLNSLPKTAEWYYLMGVIYMNKGWYEKAREFIERAASMDPGNPEYQSALNNFSGRTRSYRSYSGAFSSCACCAAGLCCLSYTPLRYFAYLFCC